jgi:hypothetical protein
MNQDQKNRVAIAKDALAWLDAGALVAHNNGYVAADNLKPYSDEFRNNGWREARDVVLGRCHVCALGGLLLAKAVRFDAVKISELSIPGFALQPYFSSEQINQIEAAYEGTSFPGINGSSIKKDNMGMGNYHGYDHSLKFSNSYWKQTYPQPTDRFRAIMQNIIRNDGDFKPEG